MTVAGETTDFVPTDFGIRTIEFTEDRGMLLNGRRVQVKGVCDHHDLGCLGSAVNLRAIQRQLRSSRTWAATPFAPATIRPLRHCWNCATHGYGRHGRSVR